MNYFKNKIMLILQVCIKMKLIVLIQLYQDIVKDL
jgi:hypothetical protein